MITSKSINKVLEGCSGGVKKPKLNEDGLDFTNDAKGLSATVVSPEESGEKLWTVVLGIKLGSWRFNKVSAKSKDAAIVIAKDHVK
jgi:hypothetical protein